LRSSCEIGAGAERLAFGGKNDRTATVIPIQGFVCIGNLANEYHVEKIVRGATDLNGRYAFGYRNAQIFAHFVFPSLKCSADVSARQAD
jgi:hypothetical protein